MQSRGNKMNLENSQEKTAKAIMLVLLLAHFVITFVAQMGNYQKKQLQAGEQVATFETTAATMQEQQLISVSAMFGIAPTLASTSDADSAEEQSLKQAKPVLLAVSEAAGHYSAKIVLSEQNKSRIVTVVQGDELLGYKLTKLTLNLAEFSNGETSLTLHMFKRDNKAETK